MSEQLIVATANFSLAPRPSAEFWREIDACCKAAKQQGSTVLLFPEYCMLGLLPPSREPFTRRIRSLAATLKGTLVGELQTMAKRHQLWLVAGSTPWEHGNAIVNRCHVIAPDGMLVHQDKIRLTRFESEEWLMAAGEPKLAVFLIAGVRCAIAICYDVEFADVAHAALREEVELLFVPSCTELEHGYWRVRHCAAARAVENQCFAVVASIVGGDPTCPDISDHYGKACILSPCDGSFPANGVLTETVEKSESEVVAAVLDFTEIRRLRKSGSVLNIRDGKSRLL
jgi:predicted amidohydrolase